MVKKAFLFPGQGAQYPGMGKDLCHKYPSAGRVFERADQVLDFKLSDYIFEGDEEDLKKTEITQPAILTVSVAVFEVIKEEGWYPDAVAGFSLGEYSALVAAEVLSLEEAIHLVQKRGSYMQEAVPAGEGKMTAIIGLDRDKVEKLCIRYQNEGVVEPSNYNCPGQVVISGKTGVVNRVSKEARDLGAKRVMDLKVSAPFHCHLLKPVEEKMSQELNRVNLSQARVPVVANVNASFLKDPGEIKQALISQVSHPVRWEQCMENLLNKGYESFLELGPGNVLTGFLRKISRNIFVAPVGDIGSLEKLKSVR